MLLVTKAVHGGLGTRPDVTNQFVTYHKHRKTLEVQLIKSNYSKLQTVARAVSFLSSAYSLHTNTIA